MSDPVRAFPLDEENTTWRSRGYLPHLERDGAVYFVTFRLADALPQHVLAEIQAERQAQMAKLRVAGTLTSEGETQLDLFVSRRVQHELDAGKGACHLATPCWQRRSPRQCSVLMVLVIGSLLGALCPIISMLWSSR